MLISSSLAFSGLRSSQVTKTLLCTGHSRLQKLLYISNCYHKQSIQKLVFKARRGAQKRAPRSGPPIYGAMWLERICEVIKAARRALMRFTVPTYHPGADRLQGDAAVRETGILTDCREAAECETLSYIRGSWLKSLVHLQGIPTPCKHCQPTHPCARCGNWLRCSCWRFC